MPGLDGLETTTKIRLKENSTGQHLPIVAMTAHAMSGDKEEYLQSGIDDYVSKPIRLRDLKSTLERVVENHF